MNLQLQSGIRRATLVRLVNKGPEHLIWAHLRPPEESAGPDPVGFCGLPLIQDEPYTVMIPADWSYIDRSIRAQGATFWESAVMRTFVLGTADVGSVLFKFLNGRVHLLEQISSFLFEVVDASAGPLRLAVYTDQGQQDMPETLILSDAMDYGVEVSITITDLGTEVECDLLGESFMDDTIDGPTLSETSDRVESESSSSDCEAGMFYQCNGRCGFALTKIGSCDCDEDY